MLLTMWREFSHFPGHTPCCHKALIDSIEEETASTLFQQPQGTHKVPMVRILTTLSGAGRIYMNCMYTCPRGQFSCREPLVRVLQILCQNSLVFGAMIPLILTKSPVAYKEKPHAAATTILGNKLSCLCQTYVLELCPQFYIALIRSQHILLHSLARLRCSWIFL